MKIETKLGVSTGVLIFLMFVSAFVAQCRLTTVGQMAHEMGDQRRPFLLTTLALQLDLANSVVVLQSPTVFGGHATTGTTTHNDLRFTWDAINTDLSVLKQLDNHLDLGPDEGKLNSIDRQVREIENLERNIEEQGNLGTPEGAAQARTVLNQQLLPLNTLLNGSLNEMVATQSRIASDRLGQLQAANKTVALTLWTSTLLGAIFGGSVSLIIARRITRGIALLADRADAIASGDLTGVGLDVSSTDQIGSLAHAMQQMQNNLSGIIGTVAQTSISLTASAVSMSSATEHIHRRVNQQSQQTQQAATAMQEMSASIAEVSRHTRSAAETARSAAETAHEGGDIVKQTLAAMDSIAAAVSETSSTIGLLGVDSYRISQIVTVIDEIATKTNLLALNAAIEAARAGDHGRGFAVVAGEVRRLAENTAQATGEISTMIQGIQQRTRTAIASMASGTVTVQQGVVTTNQAGEALERIIGIAERVDRMIAQIAIAASQQAASADQSSASLDAIHTLSHDNLSEMITTTTNIETLRATAAALESQVERFRLDPTHPKSAPPRISPTPAILSAPRSLAS